MKILVLGATGAIGLPVCQALVRGGHHVYGVTRSTEKALQLIAEEIHPIISDGNDFTVWTKLIPELDTIIQLVGGREPDTDQRLLSAVEQACRHRHPGPKLTYLYSSGIWAWGDSRHDVISDLTPLTGGTRTPLEFATDPADVIKGEEAVLQSSVVNGISVRPGLVYGKSGSDFKEWFRTVAREKSVSWFGTPGAMYSAIHMDDMADMYLRIVEKAPLLTGMAFTGVAEVGSIDHFLNRLLEVSGSEGPVKYLKPSNSLETAMASTQIIHSHLARALLDWHPRKRPMVENLETYYYASLATDRNEFTTRLLRREYGL